MHHIRSETPGDRSAIHALVAQCFKTDAEARLIDLLREAGRLTISLVAEVDGAIVGHVAFSPVTTGDGRTGAGLAPVAVLASHRRQGLAGDLIRQGLEFCRAQGFTWSVVLGDPAYYHRFGFQPATAFALHDEFGGGPAFQVVELTPGAAPSGAGLVKFSPEFGAFA